MPKSTHPGHRRRGGHPRLAADDARVRRVRVHPGAATGQEGLALAEREAPDLVLLDVKMPGMDGLEVLERLRAMNEALPVIVVSGHGTISTAVEATKKGAFDFIEKPFASERVLVSLRNALDQRRLRDENRTLKRAVEVRHQMIGESAALRQVMAAVGRAAPTNATVLIQGESGVGKELVARTIHRNSLRSRERFVQVNCAAIPEELIESELFGHEKGSFTGATEKQVGKFEQADRGTIFLDEVGDMSAEDAGQGAARAAGGRGRAARARRARSRSTCASSPRRTRTSRRRSRRGRFREDLYFRLAVIPIYVPPLRERPEDIPLLVRHYMDYFSRENNARPKRITPGGARRAAAVPMEGEHPRAAQYGGAHDHHVARRHDRSRRPARARSQSGQRGGQPSTRAAAPTRTRGAGTLREFKDNAERAFLVAKLRENGWNISKTAEVIDTPRSNLYKKLEQYQISQETDG